MRKKLLNLQAKLKEATPESSQNSDYWSKQIISILFSF